MAATLANWELRVNFPNNQLRVEWIVRLWENQNGLPVVLSTTPFDLSNVCKITRGFTIRNERGIFDGRTSFIECPLPSFIDTVMEINPRFKFPGDRSSGDSWITAQVQIGVGEINPLFSHPDLRAFLPASGSGRGVLTGHTELVMRDDRKQSVTTSSNPWQTSSQEVTNLWSGKNVPFFMQMGGLGRKSVLSYLLKSPGNFQQAAQQVQEPASVLHWVASTVGENMTIRQLEAGIVTNSAATTAYIGHDPIGNTYFHGELFSLLVDPPIREH